jgi:hypothetical protein
MLPGRSPNHKRLKHFDALMLLNESWRIIKTDTAGTLASVVVASSITEICFFPWSGVVYHHGFG